MKYLPVLLKLSAGSGGGCQSQMWSMSTRHLSMSTPALGSNKLNNITVFGSGLMGGGICQVSAAAGNNVKIWDFDQKLLGKCQKTIESSLNKIAGKKFKDDPSKGKEFVEGTLGRITFVTDKSKAIDDNTDLVVEAIIENIGIKQAFFAELDKIAPAKTIFSTNTSSLSVGDILRDVKRQDKVVGLHFFSPVPMMKLLEIIRINSTSEDTFNACQEWGKNIGKITVSCKDKPGFIVNRLLFPYMVEAMNLVDQGDATPKDVDLAMKFGAGYPMGPFELIDFVGLDLNLMILEGWEKKHPGSHLKCPEILKRMVKEGKLGVKSGEGFYKYDKK